MKNWMTTLFGILAAVGIALAQTPGLNNNKTVQAVGTILTAVGAAGTGFSAKDKNVTGVGEAARKAAPGE